MKFPAELSSAKLFTFPFNIFPSFPAKNKQEKKVIKLEKGKTKEGKICYLKTLCFSKKLEK